jgi:hypothetical protein
MNSTISDQSLDQFSDRLGGLIPGGSQLPSRHPIKVSLVMCLLGMIAGFGMLVSLFGVALFIDDPIQLESWAYLVPPMSMSGFFILSPLAIWHRAGVLRVFGSVVIGILAHTLGLVIISDKLLPGVLIAISPVVGEYMLFIPLAAVASVHSIWIGTMSRRFLALIVSSTLVPSSLGILEMFFIDRVAIGSGLWSGWLVLPLELAFVNSYYCSLAICLGSSIWETTPRLRFECTETDRSRGANP